MKKLMWIFAGLLNFWIFTSAHAVGNQGGWSLGGNLGFVSAGQTDLNTLRDRANERSSISTPTLGNAWEGNAFLGYRFTGIVALQFRPSFFYQNAEGKGATGDHQYKVLATTFIPTLKFYLLESNTIKFFSQLGIGVGFVNGTIKEGDASVDFSGYDMGYSAGLGAEFCFFGGPHCMNIEGNFRYMFINRVTADKVSGDFTDSNHSNPSGLSQAIKGKEVELDNKDVGISLSGAQLLIGYIYYF
jgi:hypothetical protein